MFVLPALLEPFLDIRKLFITPTFTRRKNDQITNRGKERLFIKNKNMNILSDALNDLIKEILFGIKLSQYSDIEDPEDKEETIEKYVERIKNELNVEKYLK
jgi:hypothetical protein